ncbi:MAG: hypothetical protein ACO3JL_13055 [Myxococcota bacterium]
MPAKRPGDYRVILLGRPAPALRFSDEALRAGALAMGRKVEVVDLRVDGASLTDALSLLEGLGPQLLPDAVRLDLPVSTRVDPAFEGQLQALAPAASSRSTHTDTHGRLSLTARSLSERCHRLRARCGVVVEGERVSANANATGKGSGHADTTSMIEGGLEVVDLRGLDEETAHETVHAAITERLTTPLSSAQGDTAAMTPTVSALGPSSAPPSAPSTKQQTDEELVRLRSKLTALHDLRDEMKHVITELTRQRQVASELEGRLGRLQRGKEPGEVSALLAEANRAFTSEASGPGGILDTAKRIDKGLEELLTPEPSLPDEDEEVRALKRELATQQDATRSLGSSTAVAFRAMRTLGQLRHAVRLLEARQP